MKDPSQKGSSLMGEEDTIVTEVKRLGLSIDRYVDLELRVGDILIIYLSRTSAWKIEGCIGI